MENYDSDRFHSRKNPRLPGYDYATPNYYFVTICTWEKKCIFGSGTQLSGNGKIAEQGLLEVNKHFPTVKLDKFVVMPNHIHGIFVLEEGAPNLSAVIGQYKSYVSRQIRLRMPGVKVWQSSYHDHVIRDQKAYEKIWLYIDANPLNWEKDCFFAK